MRGELDEDEEQAVCENCELWFYWDLLRTTDDDVYLCPACFAECVSATPQEALTDDEA